MENQNGIVMSDTEEAAAPAEKDQDSKNAQYGREPEEALPVQKDSVPQDSPLPVQEDSVPQDSPQPVREDSVPQDSPQPVQKDSVPQDSPQPAREDSTPQDSPQPAREDSTPQESPQPGPNPARGEAAQPASDPALEEIRQAIANLQQCFDDKIAQDKHKNAMFDEMHRELVRHQNGMADKNTETMAMDIIQLIDSTKNHIRIYEEKERTQDNYNRLLRLVKGLVEDLQDVLYRQSIESYQVAGEEVDVRRQKIIQTLETEDPAQNNTIAVRVAEGYEKGDKILRPERIKIYKYHNVK